ncbi:MAG TPA: hypothetical protein VHJ76_07785 [Actinomycetota bacterium]|nr:hypothetical protein [Actinomycetota bacterium]
MYLNEVTRRERRQTLLAAIAIGLVVFIVGAPVVEAQINRVRLAGGQTTAKIKDSNGDAVESLRIPEMGLTDAPGSGGAVAVRNFAGGGGLLGAGDCTASTEPAQGPLPNTVTLGGGNILTGIIITGTGTVRVTTDALGPIPLANFTVNAENPNEFVGLGNGLTITTPLHVTGIDGTACNFVLVGQGEGAQ